MADLRVTHPVPRQARQKTSKKMRKKTGPIFLKICHPGNDALTDKGLKIQMASLKRNFKLLHLKKGVMEAAGSLLVDTSALIMQKRQRKDKGTTPHLGSSPTAV